MTEDSPAAAEGSVPSTVAPEPPLPDHDEVTDWLAVAMFLHKLLDDIDTLDDAAKGNDAAFRQSCYLIQRRRFEVSTTDGYEVRFFDRREPKPDPNPSARGET